MNEKEEEVNESVKSEGDQMEREWREREREEEKWEGIGDWKWVHL